MLMRFEQTWGKMGRESMAPRVAEIEGRVRRHVLDWYERVQNFVLGTSYMYMIDSGLVGGVPREQKMLQGHLPRVIYHQVY